MGEFWSGRPSAQFSLHAHAARLLVQTRSAIERIRTQLGPASSWWAKIRGLPQQTWTELLHGFPLGFASTVAWARDRSRSIEDRLLAIGVAGLLLYPLHAGIVARVFTDRDPFRLTGGMLAIRLALASLIVAGLVMHHRLNQSRSINQASARWSWVMGSIVAAVVAVTGATLITAVVVGAVAFIIYVIVSLVAVLLFLIALLYVLLVISDLLKDSHPGLSFLFRLPAETVMWIGTTIYVAVRLWKDRSH